MSRAPPLTLWKARRIASIRSGSGEDSRSIRAVSAEARESQVSAWKSFRDSATNPASSSKPSRTTGRNSPPAAGSGGAGGSASRGAGSSVPSGRGRASRSTSARWRSASARKRSSPAREDSAQRRRIRSEEPRIASTTPRSTGTPSTRQALISDSVAWAIRWISRRSTKPASPLIVWKDRNSPWRVSRSWQPSRSRAPTSMLSRCSAVSIRNPCRSSGSTSGVSAPSATMSPPSPARAG